MTAYWLSKTNADITIIERFPTFRTGGQAIVNDSQALGRTLCTKNLQDIRTSGVNIMRKIPGMEASVRSKHTSLEGLSFVDDKGRPYGVISSTGDADQQSLVSEFEIFRGDLARILYDLTSDNPKVKYVFGEQIASMQSGEKDGPVTVTFSNGHPTTTYDLVVACDGATSRTRAMAFNCSVREHIHSVNTWAAYFSTPKDLLARSKIGRAWGTTRGRWLAVGPDPTGINRITIMGIKPMGGADVTQDFRTAVKGGDQSLKDYIAGHFAGITAWKVPEVIQALNDSTDLYASEIVQVKIPKLYNNRVAFVGDAGHATGPTGTGTTAAMTAAYILAGELSRSQGDIDAGLAAYDARMKPILSDMQKIPPGGLTFLGPQTSYGVWIRNWLFAVVAFGMKAGPAFSWISGLFSSAFSSASDKYNIPDYQLDDCDTVEDEKTHGR